ncbi:MAG: hypothetical protein JZU64_11755 [Rhodoferax sp.]|jgi:hypothetical protein|nr:hypothetical protein [Rhodoferax sp.]
MNANNAQIQHEAFDLEVLTDQEYQNQQADRLAKDVFDGEANAEKTGHLITSFVTSYEQHKNTQPIDQWLIDEFKKYPDIWKNAAELQATAIEIIASVKAANDAKQSLDSHLNKGKSRESWLASKIEEGAGVTGNVEVGQYAAVIDTTLEQANIDMVKVITNNNGAISQAPHLHGFLAEQSHVDSFNLDAASQGSTLRARVLNPVPGEGYAKNSMDIGIYDDSGKLVRRYQSKYGQDAESTSKLFEKGDYRGQRKLVPADQIGNVNGATDKIEMDGVQSKPLTHAEAKKYQEQAQKNAEAKQYEWNEVSRINIAKTIGKQALIGAGITAGLQGIRILSRRVWNKIKGEENPPASEDLKEFFESSLENTAHVGVQVAVSGAIVVAVKNGLVGKLLQGTPAGQIANVVCCGMQGAKVLYKFAKGEITSDEALDEAGRATCSAVGSLVSAGYGMTQGAALGAVLGPVGVVLGGFVGGVVGGMAGSTIGEAVFEGGKAIIKTSVKAVKTIFIEVRTYALMNRINCVIESP